MAYEIWDGFDHYDATTELWTTRAGSPVYSTANARFPALPNCVSKGMACGAGISKRWNLSGNRNGLIVSMAFGISSLVLAGGGGKENFLSFQDNGFNQCMFAVDQTGAILVRNGAAGVTVASTGPAVISSTAGPVFFLDVIVVFGSTTGSVTMYLSTAAGGAPILAATNINTINTANAYANQVGIGELSGNAVTLYFDDFHCHTNGGAAPNTVMGEGTRIHTKMPNGAGFATTLTPNGAAANWQCVDDVPPDDDTTYNAAASFPLTEGYAIGAAGFTGTVNGVVRKSRVRKDDAGAHTFQSGVRSGSTNSLPTAVAVNSAYSWIDGGVLVLDPATSAAWSTSGADAAQPIISAAS
jgi:hypothetical protein